MARREKMTAGERIACEFASGGDWGPSQRRDIARRIDAAIRKAANAAAWDVKLNAPDESVYEWIESKYGPRPKGRSKK